ncbi:DUF1329 domain-containing protein [Noviherbaspirillum sedimenti]|uniref:DUF1329 domain-containing protein n=1 Tax=Noviherbaspirillum sedimenti TaxID=2320865 RepID=A0A3A3G641_9BURK|nr:DUF1329 domain-containing protein [Noviherbaspirillum sedimenti]RJG03997.1 DUF1329 domain-containing protein [Noviherbaspirillum sedimenti]
MNSKNVIWQAAVVALGGALSFGALAAVPASEAEQLKSTLTPFGAEKAGNKDGSIPAWSGGYTTAISGFKNGGRRDDPFAEDKPLFSITAKNVNQYADKLTDGAKALFQKYPGTYRIDVYPTRRTAAAPQWVYDNTFKNATRAKIVEGPLGAIPEGAYGGIPFPIPKTGVEVLWNHLLRWRGESISYLMQGVLGTADGRKVMTVDAQANQQMPYYAKDGSVDKFGGDYWTLRVMNSGPAVRAGEGIVARFNVNGEEQTWVYLPGQRRVRKLPNACCDTPTPATAGVMSVDDIEVFAGPNGRFNWKLLGKKEMIIPYNSNKLLKPTKQDEVLSQHHINPDVMRWELHRVWVVEAELKEGKRHQAPKSKYYFDEDTWNGVLADRWDANGQLWKTMWMSSIVMPDLPATSSATFGFYDLVTGTSYTNVLVNEKSTQFKVMPRYPDSVFTPDGLITESIR